MPNGKPANTPCIQLTEDYMCAIFGQPERPQVCSDFTAEQETCGNTRNEALIYIARLEAETSQ